MAHPKRKHTEQRLDHVEEQRSATIVAMPMPAPPPQQEQEPPFERIGDILRRERERRGDDIQQIADHLCIRRSFLIAIEDSHYDEFPADIYVVGFLRSYAQYLNMDGQEVVDYYRHEMEGRRKKPALILPVPISEGRTPSTFILIGAAVAALLIYIAWYSFSTSDRTAISAPPALPPATSTDTTALIHPNDKPALPVSPPTDTETTTPAAGLPETVVIAPVPASGPAMTPAPIAATTPAIPAVAAPESILPQAAAPIPGATSVSTSDTAPAAVTPMATAQTSHVMIKAQETSWVLIADSKGHAIYDNVMKAGEAYSVPDTPGLTLTTGNGAGLLLTLDGNDLPKISKNSSRIIHNVPLNAESLKKLAK